MLMKQAEKILNSWSSSLCKKIDIGGLFSRNQIAHKWKATYRSIVLRELTMWRLVDLLNQAVFLGKEGHILGDRILLRSALETIGVLIYLNQKTEAVLEGKEKFSDFSNLTSRLLLGSKDGSTEIDSVNILTILGKCNRKYPGIFELYKIMSESAHPNYEGVSFGYSIIDKKEYVTYFENQWEKKYGDSLEDSILTCLCTYDVEYNNVWPELFERLEQWLTDNDEILENKRTGI